MQKGNITIGVIIAVAILAFGGSFLAYKNSDLLGTTALRVLNVEQGGTGTGVAPALDELLIGDGTGEYTFINKGDLTGTGGGIDGTGTSSQLAFFTDSNTLSSVATGTLTETATGLEFDTTRGLIGGASVLSLTSGYAIPTTTRLVNHDLAYSWGNHALAGYDQVTTAGDGLTRTLNDFDCDTASGSIFGCLTSTDWTTFNNKQNALSTSSLSVNSSISSSGTLGAQVGGTNSQLSINMANANSWTALQTFATYSATAGTTTSASSTNLFSTFGKFGNIVSTGSTTIGGGTGATGLTVAGTATTTNLKVTSLTASRMVVTAADNLFTTTAASSVLLNTLSDETGTGVSVFATNPLLSGFRSNASSTIGNGTGAGGLTIFGNSTTTGNSYIAGNVGIATTSPRGLFDVAGDTSAATAGVGGKNVYIAAQNGGSGITTGGSIFLMPGTKSGTGSTTGIVSIGYTPAQVAAATWLGQNALYSTGYGYFAGGYIAGSGVAYNWGTSQTSLLGYSTGASASDRIVFNTNAKPQITLDWWGNFGVGSTTPNGAKLSVTGTAGSTTPLFVVASSTNNVLFTVQSTGNVGISTTTPESKLDVWGTSGGKILTLFSNAGTKFMEMLNTGITVLLGAWDFGGADSVEIPNGTNPTVDAAGELALDTTDNQLLIGDSANTAKVIRTKEEIFNFAYPSTSPAFATGTVKYLPIKGDGYTVTDIDCFVEGGTSKAITLFGESITCDADGAVDDGTITIPTIAAASTTAGGGVTAGNTVGVVNWLNVTISGYWTRE